MLDRLFRRSGDTLIAFDLGLHRLSVFNARGALMRFHNLASAGSPFLAYPIGMFADGTVLMDTFMPGRASGPARVVRDSQVVFRSSRDGETLLRFGPFPGIEQVIAETGAIRPNGQPVVGRMPRPFGRFTAFLAAGRSLIVGDNAGYELRRYSLNGTLLAIVRRPYVPVEVTDEDLADYFAARLRRIDDAELRERRRRAYRRLPDPPRTFPAFGGETPDRTLRVDDCGNTWVREYGPPGDESVAWTVFDPRGTWLGSVPFPGDVLPLHIGDDFLLGLTKGRFDVRYVELYDLRKPGSDTSCASGRGR